MGQIQLLVPHWVCEFEDCHFIWPARYNTPPKMCPQCGRINWFHERIRQKKAPKLAPAQVIERQIRLPHHPDCDCIVCKIKKLPQEKEA